MVDTSTFNMSTDYGKPIIFNQLMVLVTKEDPNDEFFIKAKEPESIKPKTSKVIG